MPALYVVQQNARLRIDNRRLEVELEGEELISLPIPHVSQVVVFGNIGLTTPAIGVLLEHGIQVVFLSEDGKYKGSLEGALTPHVGLRRAQYLRLEDPNFTLAMARGFVQAKLEHQRALLLRHNRDLDDPQVAAAAQAVRQGLESLPARTSLPAIVGQEGAATAAYFSGFKRLFGEQWRFDTRNRRPPRDPINVLLSLGYTLLTQIANAAVQTAGLDPFAGYLHEYAYNRPALALDLVEEFRPVLDGVVLWCCRGGQVTPDDFTPGPPERPVVLSPAGMKRFLQAFETRMDQKFTHPGRDLQFPMRQCIVEQARQIASRVWRNQPGYEGMGFR